MTIDEKREAIKTMCESYEDCINGCPLWKHARSCHASATEEEIERNYKRMKEAEKCQP